MKKIFDWKILIIILLIIILGIMIKIYFSNQNETDIYSQTVDLQRNSDNVQDFETDTTSSSSTIVQTSSEIISGLSEDIELHATYYLLECYVQTNQEVKKGENILQYTNGTYLVAPYDCVITSLNIPDETKQCTNEHYISISSINILAIEFNIDETKVGNLFIGQNATIGFSAFEDKVIEGYITKISNTASGGKFTITVQFENDGDIKIGMTASVKI